VTGSGADPVKVTVERSGGFAGMKRRYQVDTGGLDEDAAARLRQAIEDPAFFDLPSQAGRGAPGADRFEYVVTVELPGRTHTVRASEGSQLDELVELVRDLASGIDS
jgi:Emfourin